MDVGETKMRVSVSSVLQAPRAELTAAQQLEALRRVQAAAQQRVQLGQRLFMAAEKQTARHQQLLEELQAERRALRQQMHEQMQQELLAASGTFQAAEDRITEAVIRLEQRVEQLASQWNQVEQRLLGMLQRAQSALDQARQFVGDGVLDGCSIVAPAPEQNNDRGAEPALSYRALMARIHDQQHRQSPHSDSRDESPRS
jgi:hypothetical protein